MKLLYYTLGLLLFVSCAEKKSPENSTQSAAKEQNAPASATNSSTENNATTNSSGVAKMSDGTTGQLSPPSQGVVGSEGSKPKQSPELITEIFRVLDLMSSDKVEMNRNDEMMAGPAAAKLLKSKYLSQKLSINTWEDFIREVATQSSSTGKPYTVSTMKKKNMLLSEYLENLHSKK